MAVAATATRYVLIVSIDPERLRLRGRGVGRPGGAGAGIVSECRVKFSFFEKRIWSLVGPSYDDAM
jgi:hypothetical protein